MKIIAANFKSNLNRKQTIDFLQLLDSKIDSNTLIDKQTYIFPAMSSLTNNDYKNIQIGAQNCHFATNGAFTGETSLIHLQEFNINTILIAHSERRNIFGEDDNICAEKFNFFKNHNFKIFYCIGESLEIRNSGKTLEFLKNQILQIDINYKNLILAYEPIWAIGTGLNASKSQILECINFIKTLTSAPVIYGGSVNHNNAKEILDLSDGLLVGSASLDINKFYKILEE